MVRRNAPRGRAGLRPAFSPVKDDHLRQAHRHPAMECPLKPAASDEMSGVLETRRGRRISMEHSGENRTMALTAQRPPSLDG